jgi:hypothetical protein
MKRYTEIRRRTPLRSSRKGIMRASYIRRSTKRIRQVNPEAEKRRRARRRKWYASAEYQQDRAAAFARDGHRCTFVACLTGGPKFAIGKSTHQRRCEATTDLQYHETSYRGRKGVTICGTHHALVEVTYYPHRRNGR